MFKNKWGSRQNTNTYNLHVSHISHNSLQTSKLMQILPLTSEHTHTRTQKTQFFKYHVKS